MNGNKLVLLKLNEAALSIAFKNIISNNSNERLN